MKDWQPHWLTKGTKVLFNNEEKFVKETFIVDDPDPTYQTKEGGKVRIGGDKILLVVFTDGTQTHGMWGIKQIGGKKRGRAY